MEKNEAELLRKDRGNKILRKKTIFLTFQNENKVKL